MVWYKELVLTLNFHMQLMLFILSVLFFGKVFLVIVLITSKQKFNKSHNAIIGDHGSKRAIL
jgi:hypothetical protein